MAAGEEAIGAIDLALEQAGITQVETILDFACGAGRVMRTLRAEFPNAQIAGCDTWREGLAFCAETFDANPFAATAT